MAGSPQSNPQLLPNHLHLNTHRFPPPLSTLPNSSSPFGERCLLPRRPGGGYGGSGGGGDVVLRERGRADGGQVRRTRGLSRRPPSTDRSRFTRSSFRLWIRWGTLEVTIPEGSPLRRLWSSSCPVASNRLKAFESSSNKKDI